MFTSILLTFAPLFDSETAYFSVWMQGSRVGYSSYSTQSIQFQGKAAEQSKSHTELKIGLIGSQVEMVVDSETVSINGKPVQMKFIQSSAGRKQVLDAWFGSTTIKVDVNNNGAKSSQTLEMPKDGTVIDDPVTEFALKPTLMGQSKTFYVLDPSTVSLVKNVAKLSGKKEIEVNGIKTTATAILIEDPRMNTTVYTSGKGDILKISTTIGLEMMPATKEEALGKIDSTSQPDIAALTSIKPSKPISAPMTMQQLKFKLKADNLPQIPSDAHQISNKSGDAWIIDVKPGQLSSAKSSTIAVAKKAKPEWVKPSLHIPANSDRFIKLAKQITKGKTNVGSAALAIRKYVNGSMVPNAGIGVLRDANEVLDAKEGVCRDYAILTATLCRASGIPARLASGLVNFDGNFYYHAWVEVWTGFEWLGLDSVPPSDYFSATHVKLSQGNVDQAFTFAILSNAHMEVLEQRVKP